MTNCIMRRRALFLAILLFALPATSEGQQDAGLARRRKNQECHALAQQRAGLLIPLYVYPENIHKNVTYNRLMDVKRRFETVPMWVILNPASGPGKQVDANYTKAIDRLIGSGCVVLGYVATSYGKKTAAEVQNDIAAWKKLYPRTQGIFFDEMIYEPNETGVRHQASLNQHAHEAGYWPTVGNPGAETPGIYFAGNAADVIVVHEGNAWPAENRLHGDYFGGNADYPAFTRGVLVHSQSNFNTDAFKTTRKYAHWLYVTEAPFREGDATAANPWDRLSKHLEAMCEELAKP